ncbi:MAG: T9SS type A sorting domain-containing protein [Bacteroidetes bacterium]|nr:T9SS type A sorting domain-containing protein [Bacteroidota bacterium]
MKTKLIYFTCSIVLIFLIGVQVCAQTTITGGSWLVIADGGKLVSTKNVVVQNGGGIYGNGNSSLILKKDLINQNIGSINWISVNNVEFSGSENQHITGRSSFFNVAVNNPAGLTLDGNTYVENGLVLSLGHLMLENNDLTLGHNGVFGGTPSVSAMVVPTGTGHLFKNVMEGYSTTFTFPVGSNTGTASYSPATLNFTSFPLTYAIKQVGINLANVKYPDPAITGNYLNRYWSLAESGFTSFTCNATFQYVPADVTGSETVLSCTRVNPLPWITYGLTDATTHMLVATGITSFGSYTGLKSTTTPANQELVNINIPDGVSSCYDATQTITVAGNGKTFMVNYGGSAILVAGQKISMLPGTQVSPGGYLHGYIADNGNYCVSQPPALMNSVAMGMDAVSVFRGTTGEHQVRVYPNPASGMFTVEVNGNDNTGLTAIEIYSMTGIRLTRENLHGEQSHLSSVTGFMPGLYFIRVYTENQVTTVKLIKN